MGLEPDYEVQELLRQCQHEAQSRGCDTISPEVILLVLMKSSHGTEICQKLEMDHAQLLSDTEALVPHSTPLAGGKRLPMSFLAKQVYEYAMDECSQAGGTRREIRPFHLFAGLSRIDHRPVTTLFQRHQLSLARIRTKMQGSTTLHKQG